MNGSYPGHNDFILLIPCYDNLPGLRASLESVRYPAERYSILIVDDGSTEPFTIQDLTGISPHLSKNITILRLPTNKGITKALNEGLNWITANAAPRYIARLDCGDICAAGRFTKQVAFLDQYSDIDIIGSWCYFKNYATGSAYLYKTPTEHKKIGRGMYFRNMFIHPTVMWRAKGMDKTLMYPENFPHAEDYGFFNRILREGKGSILPEPLVTCEINPAGISLRYRKEQLKSRIKVIKHYSTNKVFETLGVLKLVFLLQIPYSLVLNTKRLFYGK